jgi:hypothetical protein
MPWPSAPSRPATRRLRGARKPGEAGRSLLARVDAAMRAEFGFSLTDVAGGLEELIAVSDEAGTEPYLAGVDEVRTRLRAARMGPGHRPEVPRQPHPAAAGEVPFRRPGHRPGKKINART